MNIAVRSALLSGCSAGVGLWSLVAALDIVASPRGPVRVALLPPLWLLAAAMVAGAIVVAFAAIAVTRLSEGRGARDSAAPAPVITDGVADACLPLHASWILALPYVPWLPDWVPVLRVAAGQAKYAIAGIIALQVAVSVGRLVARARTLSPGRHHGSRGGAATIIFVASLVASTAAAARLTNTPLFPSGDEPHYLVIAQSLWRDGDLKIENNHTRGDYREYFTRDLAPHYVTRGADRQIYSIHPIGLGVLMAPVYAAGGYYAAVAVQMLMAALAITLAWWWSVRRSGSSSAATWGWAAVALGTPWLINAFTLYPEIGGALFAMTAFVAVTSWPGRARHVAPWIAAGLCVALLPWFSTKYAPMSAALVVVALARAWYDDEERVASPVGATLAVLVPYAISLVGWFAFFHAIWGTYSPSAPYGTDNQTNPLFLRTGGPGLLFDQEYGLIAFTPAAILAVTGSIGMWRSGRTMRRQLVEILVVTGALFATVGAFRIWWGGSAGPGRPIIAGLGLLVLPIAWAVMSARTAPQRAGHRLLVLVGVALAVTIVVAQRGLLLAAGRDGTSGLLQWWSPSWHLTEMAPTFIAAPLPDAAVFVAIWLVVAGLAGAWLSRMNGGRQGATTGRAALVATCVMFISVVAITIVIETTLASAQQAGVTAEERSRSVLLDRFDATRLPVAIRYTPFDLASASEVIPWLMLGARSEQPAGGISVPIALNARVSLPAGRYRVRVHASPSMPAPVSGPLGIQIGRMSEPLQSWDVTLDAGRTWTQEFALDVDANFVGVRASRELSRALKEIWFEPLRIVDAHARVAVTDVVAARRYGTTTFYFHDEQAWPEPQGFWTRGRDEARFTLAAPPGRVVLRITTGPIANHLSIDIGGRQVEIDVAANSFSEVPVEVSGPPIRLRVRARDGFVPIELNPSARDRRTLGAWFELVP